jgi:hypothetical protein
MKASRYNSISVLFALPLALMLWQGSSCRSSKTNSNVNSAMNVNAKTSSHERDPRGTWGGQHIAMEVSDAGAKIEYDCAHGSITEKIAPDGNGKFIVKGVHVKERGGPIREGEENEQAASYQGSIDGDTMTLTVTLTQNKEALGTFTLTQGKSGRIVKCL